jgi:hypothetical protein
MFIGTASGQRRGGRRAGPGNSAPPTSSARDKPARQTGDPYWGAQRSIEAAIQQLEAYLRETPSGERAATARRQLEVLRSLTLAASRPEWVSMGDMPLREFPEWRVASVDPQAERTRVVIEVACRREDGRNCYFKAFDRHPLVLIDQQGRFHPMLDAGGIPPDLRLQGDQVVISGGRTASLTVAFAPLAGGAVSGQIYYRDSNRAVPARFTLAGN